MDDLKITSSEKTHLVTAGPFLLDYYRMRSHLFNNKHTGLITSKNQVLKKCRTSRKH